MGSFTRTRVQRVGGGNGKWEITASIPTSDFRFPTLKNYFFIHKYLIKWEQLELVLQHWAQAWELA